MRKSTAVIYGIFMALITVIVWNTSDKVEFVKQSNGMYKSSLTNNIFYFPEEDKDTLIAREFFCRPIQLNYKNN